MHKVPVLPRIGFKYKNLPQNYYQAFNKMTIVLSFHMKYCLLTKMKIWRLQTSAFSKMSCLSPYFLDMNLKIRSQSTSEAQNGIENLHRTCSLMLAVADLCPTPFLASQMQIPASCRSTDSITKLLATRDFSPLGSKLF